ncbi:hypothetical protein D3C72_1318730 [compost metagenome]
MLGVDHRRLAHLAHGQAQGGQIRQHALADRIEDRRAAIAVGHLGEGPQQLQPLCLQARRLAHGDPAPPPHAIGDKAAPRGAEQQGLVAQQGQPCLGRRRVSLQQGRAGALDVGGPRRAVAARAGRRQQGAHRHRQGQDGQNRARPQEARGLLVRQEGPPQLVGIGRVAIGEEAEPQHGHDGRRQHQQPAGAQGLAQARTSVEGGAARQQQGRGQGQLGRLLPVQPLHQREDRPEHQAEQGRVIGAPSPPPQARRHQQQQEAGHAGAEMRQVDQQGRRDPVQQLQPSGEGRRRRRQEHDRAQNEGGHGEDLGRQLIGQTPQPLEDSPRAALSFRRCHSSSRGDRPVIEQESAVWGAEKVISRQVKQSETQRVHLFASARLA